MSTASRQDTSWRLQTDRSTPGATRFLHQRGITVLPDVLANAGGVTVSYFEWLQNRSGLYWEMEEVARRLKKTMDRESDHVFDLAEELDISLRTAAYLHGVKRIVGAIQEQGTREYFSED